MIGIVYQKEDKKIVAIVEDVQSYTSDSITGVDSSIRGIDLTVADYCIVDKTDLQVGDTLGNFTDVRHLIPPSPDEKIKNLEEQNKAMQETINFLLGL